MLFGGFYELRKDSPCRVILLPQILRVPLYTQKEGRILLHFHTFS